LGPNSQEREITPTVRYQRARGCTQRGPVLPFLEKSVAQFPTTLANPEVVETIRRMVQTEKAARGEVPKDLPKEVLEEIKRFGAID